MRRFREACCVCFLSSFLWPSVRIQCTIQHGYAKVFHAIFAVGWFVLTVVLPVFAAEWYVLAVVSLAYKVVDLCLQSVIFFLQ